MIQSPERWAQIEGLFHQALERPSSERDGWLRDRCGRDEALWREVATLLAADATGGNAIAAAVIAAFAPLCAR